MTFKVGDIVKLKYDTFLNFIIMKKGTEGVVLEVERTGNVVVYMKGNYNRVGTVAPCEIEHIKPSIESYNPSFITKEEFVANADRITKILQQVSKVLDNTNVKSQNQVNLIFCYFQ